MNTVQAIAPACPRMYGWRGVCRRCAGELKGRQQNWCGPACRKWWDQNHWWTQARAELRRHAEVYSIHPTAPGYTLRNGAFQRGEFLGHACWECGNVVPRVEVDHIRPAMGQHDSASCIHHQDNLRAVCIPCHRRITREQRATPKSRARRAKAEGQQTLL